MKLTTYGPNHWLITASTDLTQLAAQADLSPPRAFLEWTMGYNTLLLSFSKPTSQKEIEHWIHQQSEEHTHYQSSHHIIPVTYNGPDLQHAFTSLQVDIDTFVQLHTAATYTVRFLGFAPGFAYLDGLHPRLHLSRRDRPRTTVPAGSVAIGGTHTGIYPIASPGGWNLIGQTNHPLFTPQSNPPFLLTAGDTIRFTPS